MLIYWRVIEWKWRLFPHGWWFQDDANIFNPSKKFCVDGIGEIDIWWYLEPPRGNKMIYLVDKTRAQQSQTWMGNCETIGIPWLWGSKSVSGWFSLKSLNFRVCCCILRLGSPVKDLLSRSKPFQSFDAYPNIPTVWSVSCHSVLIFGLVKHHLRATACHFMVAQTSSCNHFDSSPPHFFCSIVVTYPLITSTVCYGKWPCSVLMYQKNIQHE